MMAAELRFSALDSSQWTTARPAPAWQPRSLRDHGDAARAPGTTLTTPGTAVAARCIEGLDVAPKSGGRCNNATSMPGNTASKVNCARAVGLGRHVDSRHMLADELEILGILERHLVGHRQGARRSASERAESRLARCSPGEGPRPCPRQLRRRERAIPWPLRRRAWRAPWRRLREAASRSSPWRNCRPSPACVPKARFA